MTKPALRVVDGGQKSSSLEDRAQQLAEGSRSAATRRAYVARWQHFAAWCRRRDVSALPASPETVALYLADHAEKLAPATLTGRLAAISQMHQARDMETPTTRLAVRRVLSGILREKGSLQEGKAPLITAELRVVLEHLPQDTLQAKRDRALLLLGFAGAFRRSELVALDLRDIQATAAGLIITLRRSKTDQEGQGRKIGIPAGKHAETCPLRAYRTWTQALRANGVKEGALFRGVDRHDHLASDRLSTSAVARIVKRVVEGAGLDPADYSGHSLRAGLATSAAMEGASEHSIMRQTGHRSEKMTRKYIRDGQLFRDNAAEKAGL